MVLTGMYGSAVCSVLSGVVKIVPNNLPKSVNFLKTDKKNCIKIRDFCLSESTYNS